MRAPSVHVGRDGRLRLERQQFSLMDPSPTRGATEKGLLKSARGANTWPVGDEQKSHDARKGCSVIAL